MRKPTRTLFKNWESTDGVVESAEARKLVDVIRRELPEGSTVEEVHEHIQRHFRKGVVVEDRNWFRSNSEGTYVFPMLDVKIVKSCWNPRDFLEGGSVKVCYVTLEGAYLRTEIKFVGWKGHSDPQIIKVVAVAEPDESPARRTDPDAKTEPVESVERGS